MLLYIKIDKSKFMEVNINIMRAPFQILAIPFRKDGGFRYAVMHRSDCDQWQFVAGGGEDEETPLKAAMREIYEETGAKPCKIVELTSMCFVPANVIAQRHRQYWSSDTYVIPEYHFAFESTSELILSNEHTTFEWLNYDDAMARLTWDSNKTALYELNCRLLANQ